MDSNYLTHTQTQVLANSLPVAGAVFDWYGLDANRGNVSTNGKRGIALAVFKSFWQIQKLLVLMAEKLIILYNIKGIV
jgi:hypothetical protein